MPLFMLPLFWVIRFFFSGPLPYLVYLSWIGEDGLPFLVEGEDVIGRLWEERQNRE